MTHTRSEFRTSKSEISIRANYVTAMEKLTERLLLREFTEQDVDAVAEFRRDPRYLEYYYRSPLH